MTINQFISSNKIKPADAVELVCPNIGFPKHYAVFLGHKKGLPQFAANLIDGTQLLNSTKLSEFIGKLQVTNIERFKGSHEQRHSAVRRALARLGEKAYNLVFNNCEHFKNWVLYGENRS